MSSCNGRSFEIQYVLLPITVSLEPQGYGSWIWTSLAALDYTLHQSGMEPEKEPLQKTAICDNHSRSSLPMFSLALQCSMLISAQTDSYVTAFPCWLLQQAWPSKLLRHLPRSPEALESMESVQPRCLHHQHDTSGGKWAQCLLAFRFRPNYHSPHASRNSESNSTLGL